MGLWWWYAAGGDSLCGDGSGEKFDGGDIRLVAEILCGGSCGERLGSGGVMVMIID